MKYLNYARLSRSVDQALYDFLITVSDPDTVIRAKIAFPEFFMSELPRLNIIPRHVYAKRRKALDYTGEEEREAAEWFGVNTIMFEHCPGEETSGEYIKLPDDFSLARDVTYDGYSDENPWYIEHDDHRYLAVSVTPKGRNEEGFFVVGLSTEFVKG